MPQNGVPTEPSYLALSRSGALAERAKAAAEI